MEPNIIRFNKSDGFSDVLKTIEELDPNTFHILKGPKDAIILLPVKFCRQFSEHDKNTVADNPLNKDIGFDSKLIGMNANGELTAHTIQTNCSNFRAILIYLHQVDSAWDDIEYIQLYLTKRERNKEKDMNIKTIKQMVDNDFNLLLESLAPKPTIIKSPIEGLLLLPVDMCDKINSKSGLRILDRILDPTFGSSSMSIIMNENGKFNIATKRTNSSLFRAIIVHHDQIKKAWEDIKRAKDFLTQVIIEIQTLED